MGAESWRSILEAIPIEQDMRTMKCLDKAVLCRERGKSVALLSLGCAKNLVDSEVMIGYLQQAGYRFVRDPEQADAYVVNTCGFIRPAKEEAEEALQNAVRLKRRSPERVLVVTGCYVERYRNSLRERYPEVDAWLGVNAFDKIVPAIEKRPFRAAARTFLCSHATPRVLTTPASWAYVKISEGCSHRCSFCAIPLIKGPYRSRSISSIVKEAERLASRGVRELNLISQDSTYFGRDRGMADGLVRLLRRLHDVPKIRWIRVLYGYPNEVSEALLEIMKEKKICPYLDLPFQHCHPRVLKLMKRPLDRARALALLEWIRNRVPNVAIRTTLIVGFPGEGRREFAELKDFVREAQIDHLGVFPYSCEEETAAFRLGNPVPESEKERRRKEIMTLQAGISKTLLRKYVGTTMEVLIEGPGRKGDRTILGRTRFQAPEVDGQVKIRADGTSEIYFFPMAKVEITASGVYDLQGKLVR